MIIKNAWFRFNGIDSRQMGVRVTAMPPAARAARRVEAVKVGGRGGTLHLDEGVYDSYNKVMECAVIDRKKIDEIAAWLNGFGEITFSTEPDKVYFVMMADKIELAGMMRTFQRFQVTMETQPLKGSVNAFGDTMHLTEGTTVHNKGTYRSRPVITVFGSGDITLTINGAEYGLTGVSGSITIDSEQMEVYDASGSRNSSYAAEEFPLLETGENTISWTGDVTEVEIVPNWRWL